MIIPDLAVDFIIGCDTLLDWHALLNFKENHLTVQANGEDSSHFHNISFIEDDSEQRKSEQVGNQLLEEGFFVEYLQVSGREIVKLKCIDDRNKCELIEQSEGTILCQSCHDIIDPMINDDNECEGNVVSINLINTENEKDVMKTLSEKINEIGEISLAQKDQLKDILLKNKDVFSHSIGKCNSYIHTFEVTDKSAFNHKCRPIPTMLNEKVNKAITDMLKDGIIEVSHSKYINPLCVVVKKTGDLRITVDARQLNKRCTPNHFRTQNIEQILNNISG